MLDLYQSEKMILPGKNDRIAYRMYSKKLEKEENVDSGIEVWTKRVSDLIIDKWYKHGNYHTDNGEGLDFYKVGPGRGCAGPTILVDGKLQSKGRYIGYKIIANGSILSEFELRTRPMKLMEKKYKESRRISIDAGWNLNKIKTTIDSEYSLPV